MQGVLNKGVYQRIAADRARGGCGVGGGLGIRRGLSVTVCGLPERVLESELIGGVLIADAGLSQRDASLGERSV